MFSFSEVVGKIEFSFEKEYSSSSLSLLSKTHSEVREMAEYLHTGAMGSSKGACFH